MCNKYIVLILSLFFTLNYVTVSQKVKEIRFPIEKSISSSAITVPPVIYAKTPGIVTTENYLIVMRSFSDPLYSVFELPDCNYIGGFGTLGRGPNEFEVPDARTARATENGFKIFDTHRGLLLIDITSFPFDKSFSFKQVKLPGELYILNDPIQINDSIIYGLPYAGKSDRPYVKYNTQSNEVEYFGDYPSVYPDKYKEHFWSIFWRHSVAKPDGSKFATFFDGVKMFRIYDNSENLENEVVMEIQDMFDGHMITKNTINYYRVLKATDQYLYALCLNERSNNLLDHKPTLEIWNWMGDPVAALTLDKAIFSFDVTSDNKILYCIDRQTVDKIFVYKLDDVLR